jgi:hypothetical protein
LVVGDSLSYSGGLVVVCVPKGSTWAATISDKGWMVIDFDVTPNEVTSGILVGWTPAVEAVGTEDAKGGQTHISQQAPRESPGSGDRSIHHCRLCRELKPE